MIYFKGDVVEMLRRSNESVPKGQRYKVYKTDNLGRVMLSDRHTLNDDEVFLYHRPLSNHFKAFICALFK